MGFIGNAVVATGIISGLAQGIPSCEGSTPHESYRDDVHELIARNMVAESMGQIGCTNAIPEVNVLPLDEASELTGFSEGLAFYPVENEIVLTESLVERLAIFPGIDTEAMVRFTHEVFHACHSSAEIDESIADYGLVFWAPDGPHKLVGSRDFVLIFESPAGEMWEYQFFEEAVTQLQTETHLGYSSEDIVPSSIAARIFLDLAVNRDLLSAEAIEVARAAREPLDFLSRIVGKDGQRKPTSEELTCLMNVGGAIFADPESYVDYSVTSNDLVACTGRDS